MLHYEIQWEYFHPFFKEYDVQFKDRPLRRIVRYLATVPPEPTAAENDWNDRKYQLFARAARALYLYHDKIRLHPSAIVGYYDGKSVLHIFDNEKEGFGAYKDYYCHGCPVVYFTMASIELKSRADSDYEPQFGGFGIWEED